MNKTKPASPEVLTSRDSVEQLFEASMAFCEVIRVSNTTRRKLAAIIRQLKKPSSGQPTSEAAQLQAIAQALKAINETVHKNTRDVKTLTYELREQLTKRVHRPDGPPQLRLIRGGR